MPAAADSPRAGATLRQAPNLLTLARLAAVPLTIWLILRQRPEASLLVFVLAGLTDAVDGWLARALGACSALGATLDALADKALLIGSYASLAAVGAVPAWLAGLVIGRDVLILGGIAVLRRLGRTPDTRPLPISRLNTAAQIAVAALVLATAAFGLPAEPYLTFAFGTVAATTIASGAAYAWRGARPA